MTDRHSLNRRGSSDISDTVKWVNTSGSTVPAYGVVQFKANFSAGLNQASKPDGEPRLYFANGPVDIPATKEGESLMWNRARLVLIDGSPTVGDVVGPVADSWKMSEEGVGFLVMHQAVDGVGAVVQVGGGGGGGGGASIWGTVEEVVCLEGETYCYVTVSDYSGTCDEEIPGLITDTYDPHVGMIKVKQVCEIFLAYYTQAQLEGQVIEAGLFWRRDPETHECLPTWLVRQVCGMPECA